MDTQDVLFLPKLVEAIYGMTSAQDDFTEAESRRIAEQVASEYLPRIKASIKAAECRQEPKE